MGFVLYCLSALAFCFVTLYFVGNNYKYWIIYFFAGLMVAASTVKAETYYRFTYKSGLVVGSPGADYFDARTKASKICFQALTGGKYQGEEAGLDIIDTCSNPLKGN